MGACAWACKQQGTRAGTPATGAPPKEITKTSSRQGSIAHHPKPSTHLWRLEHGALALSCELWVLRAQDTKHALCAGQADTSGGCER